MTTTTWDSAAAPDRPPRRRLPAEWETGGMVMIAWPHAATDWAPMLDETERCYTALAEALVQTEKLLVVTPEPRRAAAMLSHLDPSRTHIVEVATNDTWTRDYGPITTLEDGRPRLLDYRFNGWGLKFAADADNLVNSRLAAAGILRGVENRRMMVLEGGSIDSDGRGSVLTTSRCLMSPNRNSPMTRGQIESRLCFELGAERMLWLDNGALEGDDTDSHVDTLARFAPGDTILHVVAVDRSDPHFDGLDAMARELAAFTTPEGRPYRLTALPLPDPIVCDGERLPATYANFLATPRAVFVPTYGQSANDSLALGLIAGAFPGRSVVGVDCRALIRQHGSLHCATMQLDPHSISL